MMLAEHKYFHWYYYTKQKRLLFNGIALLFIWLFLALTQPFGIYENNLSFLEVLFYLFLVALIWVLLIYLIEWFFIQVLSKDLSKRVALDAYVWGVKLILVTHVIVILRGLACDWLCINFREYIEAWFASLVIFSFLYLPFSFYARYQYFKGILVQGKSSTNQLNLLGAGKEKLGVVLEDLVYIKADDNYAILHLSTTDEKLKTTLIRASLKSLQEQLAPYSAFLRIHRSYIINGNYFDAFEKGNMQLLLIAKEEKITLPVSRKYKATVVAHFTHPK